GGSARPAGARGIAGIRRGMGPEGPAPVILYVNGCGHILEAMRESGAEVLSIDWRTKLSEARRRLPGMPLQGNLDPGLLLGTPEEVSVRTRAAIRETGG